MVLYDIGIIINQTEIYYYVMSHNYPYRIPQWSDVFTIDFQSIFNELNKMISSFFIIVHSP